MKSNDKERMEAFASIDKDGLPGEEAERVAREEMRERTEEQSETIRRKGQAAEGAIKSRRQQKGELYRVPNSLK